LEMWEQQSLTQDCAQPKKDDDEIDRKTLLNE
jgi:hypothetical protein